MQMKVRVLSWAALWLLWVCVVSGQEVTAPIRISVYGYPAGPEGTHRKVSPTIHITRPRRNATYVATSAEVQVSGQSASYEGVIEDEEMEETYEDEENGQMAVNRMGIPFRVARRKLGLVGRSRDNPGSPERTGTFTRNRPPIRPTRQFFPPSPPPLQAPAPPPAFLPPTAAPPAPPVNPPSPPVTTPSPPVLPPATPPTTLGSNVGPPALPPPINAPAPPPGADQAQVTDIKCMDTGSTSSFAALLSLPLGFNSIPVFEDRPSVDPTINTACRMIPTQITNDMFQLIVSDLDRCGVSKCRQPNGEIWLCLQLRFPLVNGLKLPEDAMIQIKCRPQDKTAQDTHVLRVATSNDGQNAASVFEGGKHEFQCEIGLFRKLPGTELFASIVTPQVELDLGEEVQLRSIVRAGDGWMYSRITTIIIQKVGNPRSRSILNAADLVFADGCRNPSYKVIARKHPKRDSRNPLINNFNFRMFMFQDMVAGDSLMITANVIGCLDAQDCAPVNCGGAGEEDLIGFGRKKRAVEQVTITTTLHPSSTTPPYPPPITSPITTSIPVSSILPPPSASLRRDNMTQWERNLNVRVKLPDMDIRQESIEAKECRLYLFITLGVAGIFCVSSIVFVAATFFRSRTKTAPCSPSTINYVSQPTSKDRQGTQEDTIEHCGSSTFDDPMTITYGPPVHNFPVPPTIRQRKQQVNTELLSIFHPEHQCPSLRSYYPGMLNYYGYMVVPQKSCSDDSEKKAKKSLRALKRQRNKIHGLANDTTCHCTPSASSSNPSSTEEEPIKTPHKSIIRISGIGTGANLPNSSSATTYMPSPLPRLTIQRNDEDIYSEPISLDNAPMMV